MHLRQHYTGCAPIVVGFVADRGRDFVHVAIDDATRLAYAEVLPDENAVTAFAFLRRALAFYRRHGITVERRDHRQRLRLPLHVHALACHALGIRHLRTRPYRPQTNGKAERFIRPCSAAGPTARSTAQAENAPPPFDGWLYPTTIADHTRPRPQTPIARLNRQTGVPGSYG